MLCSTPLPLAVGADRLESARGVSARRFDGKARRESRNISCAIPPGTQARECKQHSRGNVGCDYAEGGQPMSLDVSVSPFNQYWTFACVVLVIFVAGVSLVRGVFFRKRLRKVEDRLGELSGAVNRLQQLEERRFLVTLKSGTIGEVNSKADPSNLSVVPEAAEIDSSTHSRPVAASRLTAISPLTAPNSRRAPS
jgi:hypothetical protein